MTAWSRIALGVLVVAVLGIIAGTVWIGASVREETVVAHPYEEGLRLTQHAGSARCDLAEGACTRPLDGGGEVTLELAPRPLRTMRELSVRVDLRDAAGAAAAESEDVSVSFSMPGMEMGENRVRLERRGPATFDGRAVLVRCPSGRPEWSAEVRVERAGTPARAARFPFAAGR